MSKVKHKPHPWGEDDCDGLMCGGSPFEYNTKRLRVFEYEGYTILVGKSDKDNDYLTFEVAGSYDLWFHVAGYSGSHVILCLDSGDVDGVPDKVIKYAGYLAHKYSKAKDISFVDVHYVVKNSVRRHIGAPAGEVWIMNQKMFKSYKNKYE